MRNLLHNRRGSVAFATVVALVPLIGVIALGAEAGSWYVTKQHAQNAADAGAYSGALKLACSLAASSCTDTQTVDYRSKQFAAQNAFCNTGDTAYPGSTCASSLSSGTSQNVQIASLDLWNGASGKFVQVTVSQTQPTYLATVLGLSSVTIGATAVAQVQGLDVPGPCVLALSGSISFQGSPNINSPGCGLASNSTGNNAINFTGGGMSIDVGSLSTSGGCTGKAAYCQASYTYTHMPPINNPFSALDGITLPTLPNCSDSKNLTAYSAATPCKNNNFSLAGNKDINLPAGVYFISGTLELKGNASITGTALFILLPGASFSMKGTGTVKIVGNPSVAPSQLPTALQPYAALFQNMALYYASSTAVTFGGNSNITLTGNIYAPNAAVTFQGNPTYNQSGTASQDPTGNTAGCGQLIAASVAFNGNATFNNTQCSQGVNGTQLQATRYVQLVR
jgi:Flp pilus assembly protein TadG